MTLHRRWGDVVLTSCACWDVAVYVANSHSEVKFQSWANSVDQDQTLVLLRPPVRTLRVSTVIWSNWHPLPSETILDPSLNHSNWLDRERLLGHVQFSKRGLWLRLLRFLCEVNSIFATAEGQDFISNFRSFHLSLHIFCKQKRSVAW